MTRRLRIVGIRGIPARHGGFETFTEHLAPYLVERGWSVEVYCQVDPGTEPYPADEWRGVRLIQIPVPRAGSVGSILFDFRSTLHAWRRPGLVLQLGYNTAVFGLAYRIRRQTTLVNMDGIEWLRAKWPWPVKAWYYVNEHIACHAGNHLIADHPEIQAHVGGRVPASKISVIPYGSDRVEEADASALGRFGVRPGGYVLVVARVEPENSQLEIVRAFSARSRQYKLLVLGDCDGRRYRRRVRAAASDDVIFAGPVYERDVVRALRFHARVYVHGHQVGGTNPSLVEALGAGSAVLAHDNRFNRWVAGPDAAYFADERACAAQLDRLLSDDGVLPAMRRSSLERHAQDFTWDHVLGSYERLLSRFVDPDVGASG